MKNYVSVLLFNPDGKFLILRRSRTAEWEPNKWNLPSGHVDIGEPDFMAALRELKEELNIQLQPGDFWSRRQRNRPGCTEVYFSANLTAEQVIMVTLNFEHDGLAWVNPGTLTKFEAVPHLPGDIYEMLVKNGVIDLPTSFQKALNTLLHKDDVNLDDELEKAGVVKGTHKKDNPDYDPIMKNGKVVGYKKKEGNTTSNKKPAKKDETVDQHGVAHPIDSHVAFKTRDGQVLTGKVTKHGKDHPEYGKLVHIDSNGKEYTRYAHNVKKAERPDEEEKPKKNDDDAGTDGEADTAGLHPLGAKVTVKNKQGVYVGGEVVKHGEKSDKGHLIHVKTEHGVYKRYNHNVSLVETGAKVKVKKKKKEGEDEEELIDGKPKVDTSKEKLLDEKKLAKERKERAANKVLQADIKKQREVVDHMSGDSSMGHFVPARRLSDYAKLSPAERIVALEEEELKFDMHSQSGVNEKLSGVSGAENPLFNAAIAQYTADKMKEEDIKLSKKDFEFVALQKAVKKLNPVQKQHLRHMRAHNGQQRLNIEGLEAKIKNYGRRGVPAEAKLIPALQERLRCASIRATRYAGLMRKYIESGGDLSKVLTPVPTDKDNIQARMQRFTFGEASAKGIIDDRVTPEGRAVMPDQLFKAFNFNTGTYTIIDKPNGGSSHHGTNHILLNKANWRELSPLVELHEYLHHFHTHNNILSRTHNQNCPIAKHVMIDQLRQEWEGLPDATKASFHGNYGPGSVQRHFRNGYEKVGVSDTVAAITAKDKVMMGYGHTQDYFNSGGGDNSHWYQMAEIFNHFGESYYNGNAGLKELFPKTHSLAMAYFDHLTVYDNDKK